MCRRLLVSVHPSCNWYVPLSLMTLSVVLVVGTSWYFLFHIISLTSPLDKKHDSPLSRTPRPASCWRNSCPRPSAFITSKWLSPRKEERSDEVIKLHFLNFISSKVNKDGERRRMYMACLNARMFHSDDFISISVYDYEKSQTYHGSFTIK